MTLLELLLPEGRASGAAVLGSGCPPRLVPRAGGAAAADLVVLAPTPQELALPGWLDDAAAICVRRLAPDGLAYVLAPPRARRRAAHRLRARGLVVEEALLHLPDVATSTQLVPIRSAPARHAFAHVVPLVAWKQAAAGLLLGLGGAGALTAGARSVALVARRPGARPLLEWLFALTGPAHTPAGASAVMSMSWRPSGPRVVLLPFPDEGRPVVVKVALDAGTGAITEAARLQRLGAVARSAGADVPQPLASTQLHGCDVLVETRVEGDVLAPQLIRHPTRLGQALESVCGWLREWALATAAPAVLDRALLDREVLGPAEALARELEGGADYLAYLRARCAAAEGTRAALTASHNDLTMWNVLCDRRGGLGIVDWEAAEPATLPLKDFFYAVVDAVAATARYADRPAAHESSFASGGQRAAAVARLTEALSGALDVAPAVAELGEHACWLGHALDESRSAAASAPRPFLQIARRIAAARR